ncbi:hypothetical protein H4Q26_016981 [Puccinia striiformis f. sp. tritici PST-130]|nr:hypothetical protein H4Q26_016981 [Puccinia striiformis f. sp. tritici PST-130]
MDTLTVTNQIKSVPAKRTVLSDSAARINRKRSVKTPISPAEVPSEWERDAEEAQTDTQAKSTKKKTSPTPAKGAPNSNPIVKTTTTGTRQNAINSINSIKIPLRSKSQAQPSILSGSDLANAARALPDLSKIQIPLKPKSQAQPSILPGNGLAKEARALSDLNKIKIKVVEQPANPPSAYSKKTINKPVASSSRNKIDSYFVPQGRTTVIALSDSSIISKDSDQEFTSEPYDPTSESELEIITEATGRLSTKQRTLPELPEADTLKSYPRALRPLLETVSINLKYWKELIEQNNKPLQILALKTAADVQETLLNKLSLDEFKAIFDQWDPILEMKMTTRKGLTLMEKRRQISSQEMLQLQDGVYLSRPEVVNHPNNLEPMGPESNEEEMETFTSLPTSDSSTSSNQSIKTSQSAPAGIPSEPKKHEAKKSEEQPSTSTLSASLPTDRQDESKAQLSSLNPPGDHPLGTNPSRDLPGVGSNAIILSNDKLQSSFDNLFSLVYDKLDSFSKTMYHSFTDNANKIDSLSQSNLHSASSLSTDMRQIKNIIENNEKELVSNNNSIEKARSHCHNDLNNPNNEITGAVRTIGNDQSICHCHDKISELKLDHKLLTELNDKIENLIDSTVEPIKESYLQSDQKQRQTPSTFHPVQENSKGKNREVESPLHPKIDPDRSTSLYPVTSKEALDNFVQRTNSKPSFSSDTTRIINQSLSRLETRPTFTGEGEYNHIDFIKTIDALEEDSQCRQAV